MPIGQWRIYRTPGSMEKYHLPPFQRAFDHKVSSIMPDYSRIATDGRAVPQTYRGEVTSTEEVPSAYSKELITDLARNKMGFDGYVNSDSGITTVQIYGVENLTELSATPRPSLPVPMSSAATPTPRTSSRLWRTVCCPRQIWTAPATTVC